MIILSILNDISDLRNLCKYFGNSGKCVIFFSTSLKKYENDTMIIQSKQKKKKKLSNLGEYENCFALGLPFQKLQLKKGKQIDTETSNYRI